MTLAYVRLRTNAGENQRSVHLVPIPDNAAELPATLTALCGHQFRPGEAERLLRLQGMPCVPCLVNAPSSNELEPSIPDRQLDVYIGPDPRRGSHVVAVDRDHGHPSERSAPHWGRGVLHPDCVHVRETRDGVPVVHEVDGERVGFAICCTWLIADAPDPDTTPEVRICSYCVALLKARADPQP